uniref:Uncharacterized protein n=1 Tax=Mimivirus LCMiAC02 TaxID=2506609 RepID=A0A4D5XES6_9VIRU|nr:MAG: hypothetical protein LCMiAC02_03500 [Mimivirus LCMiAC02]
MGIINSTRTINHKYIHDPIYIHGDAKTLKYMVKHKWDLNTIEYKKGDLQLALGCKSRSDCMPAPPETRHSACCCDLPHLTAKIVGMYLKNVVHIYSSPKIMKEIIEHEKKNKERDTYKYIIIKCIADNKRNPVQLMCSDRDKHGRKYGEGI